MASSAVVTYVGQKISKVRWKPSTHLQRSTVFAVGGWDNHVSFHAEKKEWQVGCITNNVYVSGEGSVQPDFFTGVVCIINAKGINTPSRIQSHAVNQLSLWSTEGIERNGEAMSINSLPDEPCMISSVMQEGSVTDIKFVDSDRLLTSSSRGCVTLYKHDQQSRTLSPLLSWSDLHGYNNTTHCSCTALATNNNLPDFVSVGEDGRIVVLRMDHQTPVRSIESADSSTIFAATFVKSYEIATVNFIGQLKVWDLRQKGDEPVQAMFLSGDCVPLLCIDKHPTQPHLIVTGGQDGVLGLWDMRQERYPVTLLEAHQAEIWEILFHRSNPDHLFTCSQDGALWQWNGSSMKTPSLDISRILNPNHKQDNTQTAFNTSATEAPTPWLSADASKHKIETFSLLPYNRLSVNSVDVTEQHLVCGTDEEAVYVLQNLDLC